MAPAGLEHPALGIPERGEVSSEELLDSLLGRFQARLDLPGSDTQGRGALIARSGLGCSRVAQQGLAGEVLLGGPVGREEGLGFPPFERVAPADLGELHLLALPEGAKGQRHRQGELPSIEPHLELRREPPGEGEPPLDPGFLAHEQLPDGCDRQSILLHERFHHPGLVHGACGFLGSVRLEQASFAPHGADGLQDDGDLRPGLRAPASQAFEAVEDLEGAVLTLGHTQGQRRKRAPGVRALPPQRGQSGPQTLDWQRDDETHGRGSSTERIW